MEHRPFFGRDGQATNAEGIPWSEIFTQQELKRLRFEIFLNDTDPRRLEDLAPDQQREIFRGFMARIEPDLIEREDLTVAEIIDLSRERKRRREFGEPGI